MADEACLACRAGVPLECYNPDLTTGLTCIGLDPEVLLWDSLDTDSLAVNDDETKKLAGGQVKEDESITDVESTGRKRAAAAFPIEDGMVCEWSWLKAAGGGVKPIIGCNENLATARHHGPDKSTLNNEVGNVHRICVHCHNRWHTLNDEYYGDRPSGGRPFVPLDHSLLKLHDTTHKANAEELMNNEIYWTLNRAKRAT